MGIFLLLLFNMNSLKIARFRILFHLCLRVDSRVRVQLGPSPVNHEKNNGSDLFKLKEEHVELLTFNHILQWFHPMLQFV